MWPWRVAGRPRHCTGCWRIYRTAKPLSGAGSTSSGATNAACHRIIRTAITAWPPRLCSGACLFPQPTCTAFEGELPDADAAAREYEEVLHQACPVEAGALPCLDLCLLGLRSDGHTASLFPGSPAVREQQRWVVAARVEKLGAWRLTLTPRVINNARHVLFLVTGAEKAETVRAVLEGPVDPERLPAQMVKPAVGRMEWLLDREAASRLSLASP